MTLHEIQKKREDAISACLKNNGVFFAFSKEQFEENKTPLESGEKYVSTGMGGYLPKSKVDAYLKGIEDVFTTFEKDINENNLREEYIRYELGNHEAWYTGSIESTKEALIGTYTDEELRLVYRKYAEENQNF